MFLKDKDRSICTTSVRILIIASLIVVFSCGASTYSFAGSAGISPQSIDILNKVGQATAEIVEAVRPAIVNIATTRTVKMQGAVNPFFDDPLFRRFFGDQLRMPKERKSSSLGSGVIVDPKGYILTANHVIQGADEIRVTLSDKREFMGKVVGTDALTDIGIIKIDTDNLPSIQLGNSDKLRVGETVLAIGSPYGLSQTVTMGIVSAVGRANVGIAEYEDFIQTDAAINPGNSGGALVNVKGELVGINSAIFSTSGGYQGIGFAIPTNMAKSVMDSLIKYGKVTRGWLGVTIQRLTSELAEQFDMKGEKGVLVGDVTDGSPAEKAGLQRGDIITEFEGKKVEEPYQLRNMVANTLPGNEVTMKIIREKKKDTIKITITELPSDLQKSAKGEYENILRGVTVQDLTPEMYSKFNLSKKLNGVLVTEVDDESPAVMTLMEGDIIQEINRQKINSARDYEKIVSRIAKGKDILLLIFRNGSNLYITLSNQ